MNAIAVPQHPPTRLEQLQRWVDDVARSTRPDAIHWCDGSDAENAALIAKMQADGTLIKLNEKTHPDSWLHRSHPDDVARVEHLTFVCTRHADDAGPNNHWMAPDEGHAQMDALFDGCMRGRTMYVIPYCMGPIDSPLSRCGVEITDSPYVVANMRIMTRMGAAALARIEREGERATWPKISMIETHARVGKTIQHCLEVLTALDTAEMNESEFLAV